MKFLQLYGLLKLRCLLYIDDFHSSNLLPLCSPPIHFVKIEIV